MDILIKYEERVRKRIINEELYQIKIQCLTNDIYKSQISYFNNIYQIIKYNTLNKENENQ